MNPNDFPIHVQDNTINGKCSNCGECCTDFVPITMRIQFEDEQPVFIKDLLKIKGEIRL